MTSYGQIIEWGGQRIFVEGCKTMEEARQMAVEFALKSGWRPRYWWEVWRWHEPEKHLAPFVKKAKANL